MPVGGDGHQIIHLPPLDGVHGIRHGQKVVGVVRAPSVEQDFSCRARKRVRDIVRVEPEADAVVCAIELTVCRALTVLGDDAGCGAE